MTLREFAEKFVSVSVRVAPFAVYLMLIQQNILYKAYMSAMASFILLVLYLFSILYIKWGPKHE